MLRQYLELKAQYPGTILFFRLGDFYEMFFEDAEVAAGILDITLTSREAGNGERVPMCGVPHHSAEAYLARLVEAGHRVAVCEQVEDPRQARGLVKREVVRVVTPGTVGHLHTRDDRSHQFLTAVSTGAGGYGLAAVDVATGTFMATEFPPGSGFESLLDELVRLSPAECLCAPAVAAQAAFTTMASRAGIVLTPGAEGFGPEEARKRLTDHFGTSSLHGFGLEASPLATSAAGALLDYLLHTQKVRLEHLTGVSVYHTGDYMVLDETTRRNLEVVRRLRDGSRKGSLLSVIDRTVTSMGARLLKSWLERPLLDVDSIRARLDAVEELVGNSLCRLELQETLGQTADLERLLGRVAYGTANGRDLQALASSLAVIPRLKDHLAGCRSSLLSGYCSQLDPMPALVELIQEALVDEPPVSTSEGGLIRQGYHPEVDRLREAARSGKGWVAVLESRERDRTGIKSLKVGFNRVFGYYIEVTRPNLASVPPDYVRRQTLANAERFVTEELKHKEELILGAEERLCQLEQQLFSDLREKVGHEVAAIQRQAALMAALDCLAGLASLAAGSGYCRPCVDHGSAIHVEDGRHPVIEQLLGPGQYVPNDVRLDTSGHRMLIITGPNMAGKSTYCRQVALIVLLAQCGSFVPARSARIGVVDRIFTRVGAHDDLALGQSTFMVEMVEVSNILNNATARSLVVLDEIGRGTSTFDGLSIAWAVAEYLHEQVGARTMLATHYRELTQLESRWAGVKNYSVAVQEQGQDIVFLRKIVRGGADASYGIHVAKLAGVPSPVLARARELLSRLELGTGKQQAVREVAPARSSRQLSLLEAAPDPVHAALRELDVFSLTPLEALNKLYELQQKAREAGKS
ncbi:MAG: DNA mismatch repair protein MutS [Bacillota bacterium]